MKKLRIGLVTRREMKGYLFLLPWMIGFVTFFIVPLVRSLIFSFQDVKVTANGLKTSFIGLANYRYIFREDTVFTEQLTNFYTDSVLRLAVILVF